MARTPLYNSVFQNAPDTTVLSALLGTTKDVYISVRTDGKSGSGTQLDPYDGSTAAKLAAVRTILGSATNLSIHFGPGTFETTVTGTGTGSGFGLNDGWTVMGSGRSQTTIKMIGNLAGETFDHQAFKAYPHADNCLVTNLHIDCNWLGMQASADMGAGGEKNAKLGAVFLAGSHNKIRDVSASNAYGTLANANENWYFAIGADIDGREDGEIDNCHVLGATYGSYTNGFGFLNSKFYNGRIHNCTAAGAGASLALRSGINFGECVDCSFFNNIFTELEAAVYQDTGTLDGIKVYNNKAIRCRTGLQLVSADLKKNIEAYGNTWGLKNWVSGEKDGFRFGGPCSHIYIGPNVITFDTTGAGSSVDMYAIIGAGDDSVITGLISDVAPLGASSNVAGCTNLQISGNRQPDGSALPGLADNVPVVATELKFTSTFPLSSTDPTNGQVLKYNSSSGKIEGVTLSGGGTVSDAALDSGWNGATTVSPSKNAVYDYIHQFDTDDDGKVNVLDMGAGLVKTDAVGVVSAATAGTDVTTPSSTESFTNKTYDASNTGNVLMQIKDIQLSFAHNGDGTNATRVTTEGATYGHFTFKNAVAKASNFVLYRLLIPFDLNVNYSVSAKFTFRLGGADTGKHSYYLSMADIAPSANSDNPTFSNEIALSFAGDASGASGDIEQVGYTNLTSWNLSTPGNIWVIKLARDGNDGTLDTSTVDSTDLNLTLKYSSST